jgi:hypothetical protein
MNNENDKTKGTVSQDFSFPVFYHTTTPSPNRHAHTVRKGQCKIKPENNSNCI